MFVLMRESSSLRAGYIVKLVVGVAESRSKRRRRRRRKKQPGTSRNDFKSKLLRSVRKTVPQRLLWERKREGANYESVVRTDTQ